MGSDGQKYFPCHQHVLSPQVYHYPSNPITHAYCKSRRLHDWTQACVEQYQVSFFSLFLSLHCIPLLLFYALGALTPARCGQVTFVFSASWFVFCGVSVLPTEKTFVSCFLCVSSSSNALSECSFIDVDAENYGAIEACEDKPFSADR